MAKISFTKKTIDALPLPDKNKRSVYYDTKTPTLAIRVTSTGHKSFTVIRKIDGRSEKITLGTYPHLSIEQARKKAALVNAEIADGNNPSDPKRQGRPGITFTDIFTEYLNKHAKLHKKTWKTDQYIFSRYLSRFGNTKLTQITKSEIQKLHSDIGTTNGFYIANKVLQLMSTIYNTAIAWGYSGENQTLGIKRFPEKSRDRFLQPNEIPRLFKSLENEPNYDIRDYVLMSRDNSTMHSP